METMYEVLRFVDQGVNCRQTMDCLEGKLLIYYLQEQPEMEKQRLWDFLRQICIQVEKYQKSVGGQNYRCLTPYSLLISEEREVLLLNLDAEENEFVIRKLQQKAVRKHFQQPAESGEVSSIRRADLFGIGKIMQFVLAYVEPVPKLTRTEERKMIRIIERCTGEGKNSYEEVRQIIRDLPVDHGKKEKKKMTSGLRKRNLLLIAGALFGGVCLLIFFVYLKSEVWKREEVPEEISEAKKDAQEILSGERTFDDWIEEKQEEGENLAEFTKESGELLEEMEKQTAETKEVKEIEAQAKKQQVLEEVKNLMEEELLSNTKEGNESILFIGRELELYTLRALASAYEREEMTDEAIQAYGRLIEIEERQEMLCQAGIRKMKLEAERGQYARAVLTGEAVLEKTEGAEDVEKLVMEYRNQAEGKENTDVEESKSE